MVETQSSLGKWITIVIVGAAVIGAGIWYFNRSRDAAPLYQTVPVERGDITQEVTATGTLNPLTNVLVGCQVSGTISKIYVDYNSLVKAGQLIAELDPSTYKAQEEQAEANLANAKANLELQQAETKRESELYSNSLVSGSDYDTAVATLHEAEATVALDKAAVDMAAVNLGYCKIYSPVDGVVIVNNIEVGQTVAASFNTPELFQIANNLKQMQIDSNVAEADMGGVKDGQDVDFTVEAYPDRVFHGTVRQVRYAATIVNNVVTYDCVIDVTNNDYKLRPSMTATVYIVIAQRHDALKISNAALRFHPDDDTNYLAGPEFVPNFSGSISGGLGGHGGHGKKAAAHQASVHTVYVLSGQGRDVKLKPIQIRTGITDGIYTEVVSGLKEGDQIVTSSFMIGSSGSNPSSNPFGNLRHF
ncbi:MAG TPA: efflux RND transporter periplasmic adaptor subunit [Candidatus Sulfotelmatobacter sp.]|nr:efflux RND transporter periplasmic adaptor subunit [Candidatus Sulfotelmatobacter sp.]